MTFRDDLEVRKNFVEVDKQRYTKGAINTRYVENDHLDQYSYLKAFLKITLVMK